MNFWFWFSVALVSLLMAVGVFLLLVLDVRGGTGGGWSGLDDIVPKGRKE